MKPECYHACLQWSADACCHCKYDMDCYNYFLDFIYKKKYEKIIEREDMVEGMITIRNQYCHGEFCKMRDKCARCQLSNIVSLFPATIDWSKAEQFRKVGKRGKIETYYECGDKAKEYSLFVSKEEK